MRNKKTIMLAIILIAAVAGILIRFIPHIPNFTPIGALAIFCGAYFYKKWAAPLVALLALLASDVIFELVHPGMGFYPGMAFQYSGFALMGLIGLLMLRKKRSFFHIAGSTLLGSISFFLITNFGAWMVLPAYPKTFAGLIACYAAGVPFFHPTAIADLAYSAVLFGAYYLLAEHSTKVVVAG